MHAELVRNFHHTLHGWVGFTMVAKNTGCTEGVTIVLVFSQEFAIRTYRIRGDRMNDRIPICPLYRRSFLNADVLGREFKIPYVDFH